MPRPFPFPLTAAALGACTSLIVGACAHDVARSPRTNAVAEDALAGCLTDRSDPAVTTWTCGSELVLVESWVPSASERELADAFDGFAASLGETPRRVDSVYAVGGARHTAMRLEGSGQPGALVDAQMVAIATGSGVRLVTCSNKDPKRSCGAATSGLVTQLGAAGGGAGRAGGAGAPLW